MKFAKMHGTGNDYVYVHQCDLNGHCPETLARKISNRHFGIGSDGLVLILNSCCADFRMRMFNADGLEAAMCGNASRCVGKYLYEKGLTNKTKITLETGSGIKTLWLKVNDGIVSEVTVNMGVPVTEAAQIPVLHSNTLYVPVEALGRRLFLSCVSMGNPHAVIFVDDVENYDIERIGKAIENHPLFPERCNVEFAEILTPSRIKMRVWERGSGETQACGTGACATLVAGVLNGRCNRQATVILKGGEVRVAWNEITGDVFLTGGAEWVFNGEYLIK